MIKQSDTQLTQLLQEEIELLTRSMTTLELSVEKCQRIGFKEDYSFEESESIDSLSSKFGRSSDIMVQKVMRTVWMLLHESFLPFIDFMNRAEKLGLIDSSDQMIEIRDLRNQIAHEYLPNAIIDLLPEVLSKSNILKENYNALVSYLKSRELLSGRS